MRLHGTEIERPLAIVPVGGLVTSTLFTLLALLTFYTFAHRVKRHLRDRGGYHPAIGSNANNAFSVAASSIQ